VSRFVKQAQSNEEKVAIKIGALLSDFRLDLESVGFYLNRVNPFTVYRRIVEVVDSSEYQIQNQGVIHDQ
jgi:type I restriction-modification system DNA methylase subunit